MRDLDRYMDDFGAQLRGAQPPRTRRALALGGAMPWPRPSSGAAARCCRQPARRPVDAVAAARQALDPTGVILHFRIDESRPRRSQATSR